jgi:hypothetical protein
VLLRAAATPAPALLTRHPEARLPGVATLAALRMLGARVAARPTADGLRLPRAGQCLPCGPERQASRACCLVPGALLLESRLSLLRARFGARFTPAG